MIIGDPYKFALIFDEVKELCYGSCNSSGPFAFCMDGKMLPSEYLDGGDGYFMEDEVKKKARAFVKEYYENTYPDEVKAFAKEHLNAELYGFPFRWEDYEAFKEHIDKAYKKYLNGNPADAATE